MVIDVTAEDIAEGMRWRTAACPVALALRRTFPRRKRFSVSPVALFVGRKHYATLPAVARWIRAFDSGKKVRPLTFELDA